MTELNPDFAMQARATATGEVRFHINELFYSKTDKRGVIENGNHVFQRVSGYDWPDLIKAPHKIVRHPDMPKGVFYFLWSRIKKNEEVGFYAKNRDKDGNYYWVFASVVPIEGGYLSMRLKPSCGLLDKVMPIYAEMKRREDAGELTPEQSADFMIDQIAELGYPKYEAFQSIALSAEVQSRCEKMGKKLPQKLQRLSTMADSILQVHKETTDLKEAITEIRTVPLNMRILASRLENAGGPISAISVNYTQMLEEMAAWVKTFIEGDACVFAGIRDAVLRSQFLGFTSQLAYEMVEDSHTEMKSTENKQSVQRNIDELELITEQAEKRVASSTADVEAEATRFGRSVLDMKRFVTGLSSTRMMCKIESAALSERGTALTGIVEQLDLCQTEIEKRLSHIVELNGVVESNTSMLRATYQ